MVAEVKPESKFVAVLIAIAGALGLAGAAIGVGANFAGVDKKLADSFGMLIGIGFGILFFGVLPIEIVHWFWSEGYTKPKCPACGHRNSMAKTGIENKELDVLQRRCTNCWFSYWEDVPSCG